MFSGIIYHTGKITELKKSRLGAEMIVTAPTQIAKRLKTGSSLNTNGVCLTVTKISGACNNAKAKNVKMFMMNETLRRTAFSSARPGEILNLEPSLRLGDEISGHFVFGHVDCKGKVVSIKKDGKSTVISIAAPKKIMLFMARKGSVAINGVSLTITSVFKQKNLFSVALIPHTLKLTNLGTKKLGSFVNIEIDMLARYAINALNLPL